MAIDNMCPQCGSPNPSTNRFCGNCGAVLATPPPASQTASNDSMPPEDDAVASPQRDPDAYLPDWLREATDASAQAAASTPQPTPEQPAAPVAEPEGPELPAWLRMMDDTPTDPSPTPEYKPVTVQPPVAPELPAWLAVDDAQPVVPQPVASNTPSQVPPHVPDIIPSWLAEVAEGDATTTGSDPSFWEQQPGKPGYIETGELPPWLRDDANVDAPPQVRTEPATAESTELPAWLRDDRIATTEAAQTSNADAEPSWLQEPDAGIPAPTPSQAASLTAAGTSGLPSWLEDLDQEPTRVTTEASSGRNEPRSPATDVPAMATSAPWPEPQSDPLPSWLASGDQEQANPATAHQTMLPSWLQPAADEPASPAPDEMSPDSAAAGSGLPAWLRDDSYSGAQATPPSDEWLTATGPEPAAQATNDLMSWLQEPGSTNSPPTNTDEPPTEHVARTYPTAEHVARTYSIDNATTGAEQTIPASTGMPPWLSGMESTTSAPDSGLPPWLNDLATPTGTPPEEDSDLADATPQSTQPSGLPPWLEEAEPSGPVADTSMANWLEEPVPPANTPPPRTDEGFLGTLDLPAWLRDEQPADAPASAPANTPEWLRDLDTDTLVVDEEPEALAAPAMPDIERSPQRLEAMQLLERILAEPAPEPDVAQEAPRPRRRIGFLPIIAFIILLVALLYILLSPRLQLGFGPEPAPPAGIQRIVDQIAALPPEQPVLVAYEWDLRRAAELEPLEENLLASLVTRQTPLLLLTTDPQGALLTRRRSALLRERPDGFYDQDGLGFVDLGFKVGGPLALARLATNFPSVLAQDWAGRDPGQPRLIQRLCQATDGDLAGCSLDRLGMLVVLADESEDVQAWVEQVASTQPDLPVVFAVPAELAPLVGPYLTQPGWSMVAGLDGALALQATRGVYDDWIGRRADATAVGQATFGVLVVAGAIPALWNGWRARRSAGTGPWED